MIEETYKTEDREVTDDTEETYDIEDEAEAEDTEEAEKTEDTSKSWNVVTSEVKICICLTLSRLTVRQVITRISSLDRGHWIGRGWGRSLSCRLGVIPRPQLLRPLCSDNGVRIGEIAGNEAVFKGFPSLVTLPWVWAHPHFPQSWVCRRKSPGLRRRLPPCKWRRRGFRREQMDP